MTNMKKKDEPDNTERKLFRKYMEYTKERLVSALIEAESELKYIRGMYAVQPDKLIGEIEALRYRNLNMAKQIGGKKGAQTKKAKDNNLTVKRLCKRIAKMEQYLAEAVLLTKEEINYIQSEGRLPKGGIKEE